MAASTSTLGLNGCAILADRAGRRSAPVRRSRRMGMLIDWLSEGDLTTDGRANEVAGLVGSSPQLFPDLIAALYFPEAAVRGHAADALEKIARGHPEWVLGYLPALRRAGIADPVALVRWHPAV